MNIRQRLQKLEQRRDAVEERVLKIHVTTVGKHGGGEKTLEIRPAPDWRPRIGSQVHP